jgi:hypothetical protein
MIKYFENVEQFPLGYWRGKSVIELGAGTGLVSIVAGLLGNIWDTLSDYRRSWSACYRSKTINSIVEWEYCAKFSRNKVNIEDRGNCLRVKALEFEWSEECSHLKPPFDVIIACDVIANCYKFVEPFVVSKWWRDSLEQFYRVVKELSDDNTLILLAHEKRDMKDIAFFKLMSKEFNWKKVVFDDWNLNVRKVSHVDLDPVWQSEDIGIFRISKRPKD